MLSWIEDPVTDLDIADMQGELTRLVEGILTLKATLQQFLPSDDCKGARARHAMEDLAAMHVQLGDLLQRLGIIEQPRQEMPGDQGEQCPDVDADALLVVTCRNAVKDALSSFETFHPEVVSTGGPLQATHFKIMEPSIPDKALEGINRKIEKVLAEMEQKARDKDTVLLLVEPGNKVDALLASSASIIEKRLGKTAVIVELPEHGTVTEREFKTRVARVLDG